VFCELGDEQSLALSLSSFSAHVSHLARILRDLGPGDLVLVDELAGGTDPAEGAALAVAVVRHVVGKGAAAMVTTHYEPLKRLAERDPRVRSASMGLAPRTLRPTYVLRVGEIGMSAALHVAERYGLPPAVVAEARAEVPAAHRETQERLARIAELRAGAEEELRRAAEGRKAVDAERAALAEEVARARRREHEAIRTEVSGLWRQVHGLREELRTARRYLRATRRPSAETVRKVEAQVEAAAAEISPGGKVESVLRGEMPGEKVAPGQLGEGDTVYVVSIGREGILVEADRGQAVVAFGSVRPRADFSDLRRVKRAVPEEGGGRRGGGAAAGRAGRKGAQAGPTSPTPTPTPTPTVAKGPWTPRSPANTIDLRGMRVDEAIDLVDERLDRLFQAEAGAAYLVHGHGTGAVRRAVREHLRGHPLVAEWRPGAPGEGGDGTTAVRLK
jgi:DNA mismatch repair protein MutS2